MLFVLPSMVFYDAINVFFAAQFGIVMGLLEVHSIELFDDANVVLFVLHV
jgi:hypothetical protein